MICYTFKSVGGSTAFPSCLPTVKKQRRRRRGRRRKKKLEESRERSRRRRSGWKNNTDTWLSVNKQAYTFIVEVYMTSSLFEFKMQNNLPPYWLSSSGVQNIPKLTRQTPQEGETSVNIS